MRFLGGNGRELPPTPAAFHRLARIESPSRLFRPEVVALADVGNPLLGATGATARKKGVTDIDAMEKSLAHFAEIVRRDLGCDFREAPGAGAAGGLGLGSLSFCKATIEPGFQAFAELVRLDELLAECDLAVTGEGLIDACFALAEGPITVGESMRNASVLLVRAAARIARLIACSKSL